MVFLDRMGILILFALLDASFERRCDIAACVVDEAPRCRSEGRWKRLLFDAIQFIVVNVCG